MADSLSSSTTIVDIARAANVSTATVSRVLNHTPGVAQETRLRMQRVIEKTGCHSNCTRRAKSPVRHRHCPSCRQRTHWVVALATDQQVLSQQVVLPTQLIVRSSCCEPQESALVAQVVPDRIRERA